MSKDVIVVKIPKNIDEKFRQKVKEQGKQYNLSLEEAMRLWLRKQSKK